MKGKGKNKVAKKIKVEVESDSLTTEFNPTNFSEELACISDLQRKNVEDINLKDLKAVQFQLEDILVCATKRKKQLEESICSLETLSAKKIKRSRSTDSTEKKSSEERPPKKIKESNSKSHAPPASSQPKGKFIQMHYVDSHVDIPKVQKNDGPSRFWTFLEPYCAEITQDTIRAIEDWINTQNNEKYERIPELGTHFASKWPLEDMKEEMKEGSKSVENNKGLFADSPEERADAERVVNLGYNEGASGSSQQYNSLINRIVYSLVGENLMTFLDDTMTDVCNGDVVKNGKLNLPKSSIDYNADTLEKRIIREFREIGLLESDDNETESNTDEVLRELKLLQSALMPVNEYNTIQKKKVLALAKAEMAKQELKKKLQELDAKVMEVYRMVASARRNNTMSKKLEEQAKRALRERKRLVEKLKNMN